VNPTRLLTLDGTITRSTIGPTPAVDDYNNPIPTVTTAAVKCWVEQSQADDNTVDTDQQSETFRLYLPPTAAIDGTDRLTVAGSTYEIVGPPWRATSPRTRAVTHIEARGRRVA
jgi:hypothetical protein